MDPVTTIDTDTDTDTDTKFDLEGVGGRATLEGKNIDEAQWLERARAVNDEPDALKRVWLLARAYEDLGDLWYAAWDSADIYPETGFRDPRVPNLVSYAAGAFILGTTTPGSASRYEFSLRSDVVSNYYGRVQRIEAALGSTLPPLR